MAEIYLRSTDGNDSDNGTTWALAKATLNSAMSAAGAGGTVYVSKSHSESVSTFFTLASPGTFTAPVRIVCVEDVGNPQPPTTTATGATVGSDNGWGIEFNGVAYSHGVNYTCDRSGLNYVAVFGIEASEASTINGSYWFFDSCTLTQNSANTGSTFQVGRGNGQTQQKCLLRNSTIKFANASHKIVLRGDLHWDGGVLNTTLAAPTVLIKNGINTSSVTGSAYLYGVDLSGLGSGKALVDATGSPSGYNLFANCKLGSSVSIISGTPSGPYGPITDLDNCDSTDTNYRSGRFTHVGSVVTETTIVRTGGASDGTTSYSWKMTTTSDAEYPMLPLDSKTIAIWNDTTGSSKTITVEILHDSVTNLKDDEIWIEVQYLGTSGYPLSTFITDCKANILATTADQTSSSEVWTTTGMSNPNKQKVSVTFTPQEKGYFQSKVYLAKASTTVYVDPKLMVT